MHFKWKVEGGNDNKFVVLCVHVDQLEELRKKEGEGEGERLFGGEN